ncbi:placenta-specific protein 9, partial [Clarias magur]
WGRDMAKQSICAAFLLLLIGHMLAVPEIEPANRNTHTAPCQDHSKLNDRLDAVEK